MASKIEEKMTIPMKWELIEKKDYNKFKIQDIDGASVVNAWMTHNHEEKYSIVILYDYGKQKGLIEELSKSYDSVRKDEETKSMLGIDKLVNLNDYIGETKVFLSAIKLKTADSYSVDLFFEKNSYVYALHTVISELKGGNIWELAANSKRLSNIIEVVRSI